MKKKMCTSCMDKMKTKTRKTAIDRKYTCQHYSLARLMAEIAQNSCRFF